VISPSQRPLPDNTQHSHQTNFDASFGIRTHNLSRRAAVDLRLRPRSRRDWSLFHSISYKLFRMGRGSSVGITNLYGLDGPGIESRWGRIVPLSSRPTVRPLVITRLRAPRSHCYATRLFYSVASQYVFYIILFTEFCYMTKQPPVGHDLLIVEVSR
jgi:hypothetical protein